MWFRQVKATRSNLGYCSSSAFVNLVGARKSEQELGCGKLAPPFHSARFSTEEQGPAWTWLTACEAVVYFHSCFINFSERCPVSFTTICVICYYCPGYKLDTDFDYVYGPEPLRSIVFKSRWPSSRSLFYKRHNDMQRAPRKPKSSCQTTVSGLLLALAFLWTADTSGWWIFSGGGVQGKSHVIDRGPCRVTQVRLDIRSGENSAPETWRRPQLRKPFLKKIKLSKMV